MAIGAKSWDIRWQFLTEALVLSLIGGLVGVIIGLIGAQMVSAFTSLSAKVSLLYILLPFSFAGFVGLFFEMCIRDRYLTYFFRVNKRLAERFAQPEQGRSIKQR